jgi:hypothetical protein
MILQIFPLAGVFLNILKFFKKPLDIVGYAGIIKNKWEYPASSPQQSGGGSAGFGESAVKARSDGRDSQSERR